MAQQDTDVFTRLERFYDAVPRPDARAEIFGGLVLFVREGAGFISTLLWVTAKETEEWTGSTVQVPAGTFWLTVSVLISARLSFFSVFRSQ